MNDSNIINQVEYNIIGITSSVHLVITKIARYTGNQGGHSNETSK